MNPFLAMQKKTKQSRFYLISNRLWHAGLLVSFSAAL